MSTELWQPRPLETEPKTSRRGVIAEHLAYYAKVFACISPFILLAGSVIAEATNDKPFELSNVYRSTVYTHKMLLTSGDCLPAPSPDEITALEARNIEMLQDPDTAIDNFDLTIVERDIYFQVVSDIDQASSHEAVIDVINQFTDSTYGFGTKLHDLDDSDINLADFKAVSQTLVDNIADLPVELFTGIDLNDIVITDEMTTKESDGRVWHPVGGHHAGTDTITLTPTGAKSRRILTHELSHGIHKQACSGVAPSSDSTFESFNPAGFQYTDTQWHEADVDFEFHVSRYSTNSVREDFADTSMNLFANGLARLGHYDDDMWAVDNKALVVMHYYDQVTINGMSAYLESLDARSG